MKLGEEKTRLFTVETRIDNKIVKIQAINNPLINTTIVINLIRWRYLLSIFIVPKIRVQIIVRGNKEVEKAILNLDVEQLNV